MAWTLLIIAGVLEVVWAVGLKYTDGWTRLWPSVLTLAVMLIDFFILPTLSIHVNFPLPAGRGLAPPLQFLHRRGELDRLAG